MNWVKTKFHKNKTFCIFSCPSPQKTSPGPYFLISKKICMRRRKYGYILLTLLVISGLAGIPFDNTLNKQERKFASDHLKDTKSEVLKSIKGLSEAQLDSNPSRINGR